MTNRFAFRTAWGAEIVDGGARFRLWAPSQERLALRVADTGADIPMRDAGEGWFEIQTDAVSCGDGYSFVLGDGTVVNDPAARAQLAGVDGPSRLVDPKAYAWQSTDWTGRPWEEAVFYELHVGTFSPEGDFDGVRRRLDHLAETGVTAIELLPVAQFGGRRGWGYDGVLLYAPHTCYGSPDDLKRLIDEAHQRGLIMVLDVVYNHFGPVGNYIHLYAPEFFHPEKATPWGAAIAYEKKPVRDFFIDNALYWLEEYRFDGLRLDAIDRIDDQSDEPILQELAAAVRGRITGRHVHLTTEDDRNVVNLHTRDEGGRPILYSGEWNDDFHHAAHAIGARESIAYYSDYSDRAPEHLARALASGYVYQGEPSPFRNGAIRGESSAHLPPTVFVNFLQNHDQIGNRAYSERLTILANALTLEALTAILLLSPQIPLLFMGEEWGETRAFSFFTDFDGELARAVRDGRRREFEKWPHFASDTHSALIADPNAPATFESSRLDWNKLNEPQHRARFEWIKDVLRLRRRAIVPLIARIGGNAGSYVMLSDDAFAVTWRLDGGGSLNLFANLGIKAIRDLNPGEARFICSNPPEAEAAYLGGALPPLSVVVTVADGDARAP